MEQYLLCRPCGGLNDTLVQVLKCLRYSEKHHRILVIDSKKSGLMADFDEFFQLHSSITRIHHRLDDELAAMLQTASFFPPLQSSDPLAYVSGFDNRYRNYSESLSGQRLSFDFSRSYTQQLLIHEQCGGGVSVDLFRYLTLTAPTRAFVVDKLSVLPASYSAIHVRNTDHQTDYQRFFSALKRKRLERDILVCSDDMAVIDFAQDFFRGHVVHTMGKPLVASGQPLHRPWFYNSQSERQMATCNAIADLLALAGAKKLFFSKVNNGGILGNSRLAIMLNGKLSGFSRLARDLRRQQDLRARLLFGKPVKE